MCLQRDGGANCSMRYRIALAPSPDVRSGASGRLQAYAFAPIDTPDGVFQMAVSHQVSDVGSQTSSPAGADDFAQQPCEASARQASRLQICG